MTTPDIAGLHLGRTPPPVGGVTLHCQRAHRGLWRAGYWTPVAPGGGTIRWGGHIRNLRLVVAALGARVPVWIHFSTLSPSRALRLALVTFLFSRCAVYLVPHSGGFPVEVRRAEWQYRLARRALRYATGALCFSSACEDALRGLRPGMHLVRGHSFIPDAALEEERSRRVAEPSGEFTVVTSGYPSPVYNYLDVIRAVSRLQDEGVQLRLRIFHYGTPDPEYWPEVEALAARVAGVELLSTGDSKSFLRALHEASLYLRNTSHDSYGVACAEAVFLGTPVMATDVCERAPGVALFSPTGVDGLVDVLRRGMELPRPQEDLPSGLEAYLAILERSTQGRRPWS